MVLRKFKISKVLLKKFETEKKDISKLLELLLRTSVFLTFFGHGIVAIKGNEHWLVYLETVGFSREISDELIFYIGALDIIIALIILLRPNRYLVLWTVIWAFSAALIRPISGEPIWAFIERGSNWLAPLVLYLLILNKNIKNHS
ncbi:hypothetical protein [Wocania ichthyoenteri]|uniref:hypothetical protein n=1 Tax=Wocania ichthyoenteri TaxID=1230531 RepID=UPI00053D85A7|nr:hypothetical protein [Wocania ichthyoenteri]